MPQGYEHLAGQTLGAAGIPTSRIPGIATSFASGTDGVTMVLRLPKEVPIRPTQPQTNLRFEEEYVILHQIPNSNIIKVIPAREIAPIRYDYDTNNIIIGYQP